MAITLWKFNVPNLVTVGDAVASFLDQPDEHFKGRYLASGSDLKKLLRIGEFQSEGLQPALRPYRPNDYPKRWFSTPSQEWNYAPFVPFSTLIIGLLLFIFSYQKLHDTGADSSFSALLDMGFGSILPQSLLSAYTRSNVVWLVIIANTPQLALSVAYLFFNRYITVMAFASEWASYAHDRKGLRVTRPKGQQRSTYYLQLPYTFAVPLLVVSTALHYTISQSLFVADILIYSPDGPGVLRSDVSGIGYSPYAILVTLAICVAAIMATIALGFLKIKPDIPNASNCSAAIAAACHPGLEDDEAALAPVQWGEPDACQTSDNIDIGHC